MSLAERATQKYETIKNAQLDWASKREIVKVKTGVGGRGNVETEVEMRGCFLGNCPKPAK